MNILDNIRIKEWLENNEIKDYTINDDLTIDVDGDVHLRKKNLTEIPVQFGFVKGIFDISYNQLTSLKGCPTVLRTLWCGGNQLTSLKGCPTGLKILYCHNNKITSLENSPDSLEYLDCYDNQLTSLKGCPTGLVILDCGDNPGEFTQENQNKYLKK
jgi:Leucine-rich repeat (LRR) protein